MTFVLSTGHFTIFRLHDAIDTHTHAHTPAHFNICFSNFKLLPQKQLTFFKWIECYPQWNVAYMQRNVAAIDEMVRQVLPKALKQDNGEF